MDTMAGGASMIKMLEELLVKVTKEKNLVVSTLNQYKIENKILKKLAKEKLT